MIQAFNARLNLFLVSDSLIWIGICDHAAGALCHNTMPWLNMRVVLLSSIGVYIFERRFGKFSSSSCTASSFRILLSLNSEVVWELYGTLWMQRIVVFLDYFQFFSSMFDMSNPIVISHMLDMNEWVCHAVFSRNYAVLALSIPRLP